MCWMVFCDLPERRIFPRSVSWLDKQRKSCVVFDEIHHFGTNQSWGKACKFSESPWVKICLGHTISFNEIKSLLQEYQLAEPVPNFVGEEELTRLGISREKVLFLGGTVSTHSMVRCILYHSWWGWWPSRFFPHEYCVGCQQRHGSRFDKPSLMSAELIRGTAQPSKQYLYKEQTNMHVKLQTTSKHQLRCGHIGDDVMIQQRSWRISRTENRGSL